jgi:hypothetical protein
MLLVRDGPVLVRTGSIWVQFRSAHRPFIVMGKTWQGLGRSACPGQVLSLGCLRPGL